MESDITQETPQRILQLIRLCHPDEYGEPYNRSEVIDEIKRRETILLQQLGWPDGDDAIYKNRYTGSEETLKELELGSPYEERQNRKERLFSILGNWTPKAIWNSADLLDSYKSTLVTSSPP